MEEKKCNSCGKVTSNWKEWSQCKSCGTAYCPECHEKHYTDHVAQEKEKQLQARREQEKMRRKGIDERGTVICPNCDDYLTHFYH